MQKKIKEYELIKSTDKVDFVEEINEMIGKGWQPFKNVTVVVEAGGQLLYSQAMVMFEEEELDDPLAE